MASRDTIAILLISSTAVSVTAASTIDAVFADGCCAVIHPPATGSSDNPITVITEPVTTAGKKRTILANTGAMTRPMSAETITAPNTTRRPRSPLASRVTS